MEFLFSCSTRHLACSLRSLVSYRVKHSKRNSTSTRAHVLFSLYIISSVMRAFWSVLAYDLLEDRRIDDVIIRTFFNSLLYKTNRFKVAVRLFSNRSQRTSNCGKNIIDILGCTSCATFLFLPHFDVICGLLLNRRTATWNLFVNYLDAEFSPCPEKGGGVGVKRKWGFQLRTGTRCQNWKCLKLKY